MTRTLYFPLALIALTAWSAEPPVIDPGESGWGKLEGSYVARFFITKNGHSQAQRSFRGETSDMTEEWNIGPLSIAVRLDARNGEDPLGGWVASSVRADLLDWASTRESYADHQEFSRRETHFYHHLQPELDRALGRVDDYIDLGQTIYRVLGSFWHYRYFHEKFTDDPGTPSISISYGGSSYHKTYNTRWSDGSPAQSRNEEDNTSSWTLEDISAYLPANLNWQPRAEAVVWNIDAADAAVIKQAIQDLDRLRKDLTFNVESLDLEDEYVELARHYAEEFNFAFRDLLIDGLRDIVRYAWYVHPEAMPGSMIAQGSALEPGARAQYYRDQDAGQPYPVDRNGVPFLSLASPLTLPDLSFEDYAILLVPEFDPVVELSSIWFENGQIRYDRRTGEDPEGERSEAIPAEAGGTVIAKWTPGQSLGNAWPNQELIVVRSPIGNAPLDLDLSYHVREQPWRHLDHADSLAVEDVAVEFSFFPEGAVLDEDLADGAGDDFAY